MVLLDAEKKGLISNIELQPQYDLLPNQKAQVVEHLKTKDKMKDVVIFRKVTYKADFRYRKNDGEVVVEDVKASPNMLPQEFLLKEKMMYYFHRVKIRKVYKANEKI